MAACLAPVLLLSACCCGVHLANVVYMLYLKHTEGQGLLEIRRVHAADGVLLCLATLTGGLVGAAVSHMSVSPL